jgi:hypothetical protein
VDSELADINRAIGYNIQVIQQQEKILQLINTVTEKLRNLQQQANQAEQQANHAEHQANQAEQQLNQARQQLNQAQQRAHKDQAQYHQVKQQTEEQLQYTHDVIEDLKVKLIYNMQIIKQNSVDVANATNIDQLEELILLLKQNKFEINKLIATFDERVVFADSVINGIDQSTRQHVNAIYTILNQNIQETRDLVTNINKLAESNLELAEKKLSSAHASDKLQKNENKIILIKQIEEYNTKIAELITENKAFLIKLRELKDQRKENTSDYKSIQAKISKNELKIKLYQRLLTEYSDKLHKI